METKTNESGKNWLIFILLVINIGLIALFVYSINLQKVMFADEPTKVVTKSKKWIVTLEDEKHLIRLVEDKKDVNVYYDDSLITTITNASVDNKNNRYITFNGLNDNKMYLLVNISSNNVDKPFIINSEGTIIYEFEQFVFYGESHYFKIDDNYTNFGKDTETGIYFVRELDEETKLNNNPNENAFLYYLNITDNQVIIDYNRIQMGVLS